MHICLCTCTSHLFGESTGLVAQGVSAVFTFARWTSCRCSVLCLVVRLTTYFHDVRSTVYGKGAQKLTSPRDGILHQLGTVHGLTGASMVAMTSVMRTSSFFRPSSKSTIAVPLARLLSRGLVRVCTNERAWRTPYKCENAK